MHKILLEDIYEFSPSTVPICVLDLRVHLFDILRAYSAHKARLMLDKELASEWFIARWALLFNSPIGWLRSQPPKGWYTIVVDDARGLGSNNYWRNEVVLSEGLPRYKGNRNTEDRPEAYNELHQSAIAYLSNPQCTIPYFAEEGFEADDWAGCIARLTPGTNPIFLSTVDNDWLQLVNDKKQILFACSGQYKPRLRTEYEALMWAQGKGQLLDCPRGIVDYKVQFGDAGDNLVPGSPRGVIDLLEPTMQPSKAGQARLAKLLSPKFSNTNNKHAEAAWQWLVRNDLF